MMTHEDFMLWRARQPEIFRAPQDCFDCCEVCVLAIQPGEIIVETCEGFAHLDCLPDDEVN